MEYPRGRRLSGRGPRRPAPPLSARRGRAVRVPRDAAERRPRRGRSPSSASATRSPPRIRCARHEPAPRCVALSPRADRGAPRAGGAGSLAPRAGRSADPFALGAMHVPNRVTGRKWPFLDSVLGVAEQWRDGPALSSATRIRDVRASTRRSPAFNRREGAWMEGLERAGWRDAFRHVRGPPARTRGTRPTGAMASGSTRRS